MKMFHVWTRAALCHPWRSTVTNLSGSGAVPTFLLLSPTDVQRQAGFCSWPLHPNRVTEIRQEVHLPARFRKQDVLPHRYFTTESHEPTQDEQSQQPSLGLDRGNIESVLESVAAVPSGRLRAREAVEVVITLAELFRDNKDVDIMNDSRFVKVTELLEKNSVSRVESLAIVSCLKGLKELGVSNNSFCVKNLENSLTWMARSCPIKDLVMSFSFTLQRQDTETQVTLHREVIQALERRWTEIKDGRLFVVLLHSSELFSTQFMNKLEDRIADIVEDMNPSDMAAILSVLGRKRRRNVPLLRSLTYHIAKSRNELDVKQISDVLYALNRLSFKEQETLERICSGLEGQIETTESTAVVRSILTSLGQLRFSPNTIIERICDWFQARMRDGKALEPRDFSTLIVTLGNLSYVPEDRDNFFEDLLARIKKEDFVGASTKGGQVWLDIVWSLVVLDKAKDEHFSSVLEQEFYSNLLDSVDQRGVAAKLLNINAAAKLLTKNYKGPIIDVSEDPLLRDLSVPSSMARIKFKKFVLESLATLFPPPRFLKADVATGQGWSADAEVICDKDAKPLQVDEYTTRFMQTKPNKELPLSGHRIAVFTNCFQDCLLSGGVGGVTSLTMRLSKACGYTPLLIDYKALDSSMKTVTRIQKLDTMVKILIGAKK